MTRRRLTRSCDEHAGPSSILMRGGGVGAGAGGETDWSASPSARSAAPARASVPAAAACNGQGRATCRAVTDTRAIQIGEHQLVSTTRPLAVLGRVWNKVFHGLN